MIEKLFLLLLLAAMASASDTNTSQSKAGKKVYPRGTIATH
ncbi:MAG: hypothetical protein Q8K81_07505 [Sulfuricurvum sp.]|nr:hypothetical protein [Sulfuricurvum sp.]